MAEYHVFDGGERSIRDREVASSSLVALDLSDFPIRS